MNELFKGIKEAIERIAGCRIYRNTLPHGVDCYHDIGRRFGRNEFKVVFDIGANIGQSAIRYLREFPKAEIYSFEPVPVTYRELVAATSQFPRVHTFNLGMGPESGEALIHLSSCSRTSSIKIRRPEDQAESITLETIAEFTEKHHIENIDFLKIDTEGYDLEVLAGAAPLLREQRVHFILSECKPMEWTKERVDFAFADFAALAAFLAGFGYQLFGVYEQQPEWDGRNALLYWNALFVCGKLIAQGAKLPSVS